MPCSGGSSDTFLKGCCGETVNDEPDVVEKSLRG